jgi:hypothetical protein
MFLARCHPLVVIPTNFACDCFHLRHSVHGNTTAPCILVTSLHYLWLRETQLSSHLVAYKQMTAEDVGLNHALAHPILPAMSLKTALVNSIFFCRGVCHHELVVCRDPDTLQPLHNCKPGESFTTQLSASAVEIDQCLRKDAAAGRYGWGCLMNSSKVLFADGQ